jgi:dTDP-4-amino-4,6-dideoxygalactose transaminase
MSAQDRIIFGQPWLDDTEEELVRQTLRSGWIGQGPLVELFEERLCNYLGAKHVVAVSSCTAGLHLALAAAGVGPGAEVITTPFTFVATPNAITHVGASAVFVDIDPGTLNLAPEDVADAITPHTAAVLPVHFGGRPLDVVAYERIADEHGIWIVEDAAHAIGAVAAGARVGGRGHPRVISVFSFYPNKNLASAEGGAIALADDEIAERLRRLRLHGLDVDAWKRYRTGRYRPSLALEAGFKYNWTDLQAAIALGQLEKLEGFLAIREYLAGRRPSSGKPRLPPRASSLPGRHRVATAGPRPDRHPSTGAGDRRGSPLHRGQSPSGVPDRQAFPGERLGVGSTRDSPAPSSARRHRRRARHRGARAGIAGSGRVIGRARTSSQGPWRSSRGIACSDTSSSKRRTSERLRT